jgi:hypothetical protein
VTDTLDSADALGEAAGRAELSWLGEAVGDPAPLMSARHGRLALHERGFTLGPPGRERAFLFAEIQSLALAESARFDRVLAGTVERRITVRSAAGTLRFGALAVDGLPDPATPAFDGLVERLAAVADQRLRGGDRLAGPGWRLAADGLRTGRGGKAVPLSAVHRVGLFLGRVQVWKAGEELPFFTLSAGAPNARLLHGVLRRRLGERADGPAGSAPLGRFLGALGRTRIHENGLVGHRWGGRRKLLFADVGRMRVHPQSMTRRMAVYEGPARFVLRFPASHQSHELLVGRPASILADRLARQLAEAPGVPWVDGVRITGQGILRELGRGEPELLPFAAGLRVRLVRGRCHLDLPGGTRPALRIDISDWDFFPGLLLLERLYPEGFRGV